MIANCQNLHPTFRKMINGRPKKIINLQDLFCVPIIEKKKKL